MKKYIMAVCAATMMSSVAHAGFFDSSEFKEQCGNIVKETRAINSVGLTERDKCWLDVYKADDMTGLHAGHTVWLKWNDKYYTADGKALWNMPGDLEENFKNIMQSQIDADTIIERKAFMKDRLAELEAESRTILMEATDLAEAKKKIAEINAEIELITAFLTFETMEDFKFGEDLFVLAATLGYNSPFNTHYGGSNSNPALSSAEQTIYNNGFSAGEAAIVADLNGITGISGVTADNVVSKVEEYGLVQGFTEYDVGYEEAFTEVVEVYNTEMNSIDGISGANAENFVTKITDYGTAKHDEGFATGETSMADKYTVAATDYASLLSSGYADGHVYDMTYRDQLNVSNIYNLNANNIHNDGKGIILNKVNSVDDAGQSITGATDSNVVDKINEFGVARAADGSKDAKNWFISGLYGSDNVGGTYNGHYLYDKINGTEGFEPLTKADITAFMDDFILPKYADETAAIADSSSRHDTSSDNTQSNISGNSHSLSNLQGNNWHVQAHGHWGVWIADTATLTINYTNDVSLVAIINDVIHTNASTPTIKSNAFTHNIIDYNGLKQAMGNAYDQGYDDGYADGYADGYSDGFADGSASVNGT